MVDEPGMGPYLGYGTRPSTEYHVSARGGIEPFFKSEVGFRPLVISSHRKSKTVTSIWERSREAELSCWNVAPGGGRYLINGRQEDHVIEKIARYRRDVGNCI